VRGDIEVGLIVILIAGRGTEVRTSPGLLVAKLQREVEVLRPELDELGISVHLVRP
jgi:hypothetical protein